MHKLYYFLADFAHKDDGAEAILAEAHDHLMPYTGDHCDENNGSSIDAVVFRDNQLILFQDRPTLTPGNDAWSRAWLDAYQAVATEMNPWTPGTNEHDSWLNTIACLTSDGIGSFLERNVPNILANEYRGLADNHATSLTNHKRSRLSRQFEMFWKSVREESAPFFAPDVSPYDYRAFDLSIYEDASAIIIADIHN